MNGPVEIGGIKSEQVLEVHRPWKKSTEGYRNMKLLLELWSGLMTDFIEDTKGYFEP